MAYVDDYELSQLGKEIAKLRSEVEALKRGQRADHLGNSSLREVGGRGYIPFYDKNGVERARFGRMPDGTVTNVSINNPNPPSRPKPPVVIPGLGSLTVGVEALEGDQPYDFAYCRVYVDGLLDGTIPKLPGVWPVSPLSDGQHSIQVSAVNQSGKESAKTAPVYATPDKIIIPPGRDFTANPILSTEINDKAITTPKLEAQAVDTAALKALAVTAAKIAAQAIEAEKIKAGAVTAAKLEAIMVIANRIVCGASVEARRLEISASGIEQYDEIGQLLTAFGANAAGGNFLTVVDPDDTQTALASLDSEGIFTCSGFAVNGGATIDGENLMDMIYSLPRGLVAYGQTTTPSAFTTSEVGIFETEFQAANDRAYEISTSSVFVGGNDATSSGALRLHYTTNGSRPTISSPLITDSTATSPLAADNLVPAMINTMDYYGNNRVRLLLSVVSFNGKSVRAEPPIGDNGIQLWVKDIGPRIPNTGAPSSGGGNTTAPVANYTKTYDRVWSRSYNSASSSELYQGDAGYGAGRSLIGFNDSQIRSDLSGATISKVELYLYANHWWFNSGGTVILGTHNWANPGSPSGMSSGSYPGLNGGSGEVARWHLNKPEGRWVTIPNSVGNALRDNSIKGVALPYGGTDKNFYGKFNQDSPKLRITYRK